MKLFTALFFIAIGVFLAFRYPDTMFAVYGYIDIAWSWLVEQFNALQERR
ncbi:hypothetical protein [Aliidiomarina quisquiliarum]|nr:hypothetical protein [Aliidiomarina quisquiliarum]MCO4319949.1 hypothetical protein [Aliidiomarina quisquiliarum]